MNNIDIVSKLFQSATEINFEMPDKTLKYPVIMLGFNDPNEVAEGYEILVKEYKKNIFSIIIIEQKEKLDITLRSDRFRETITIKNLSYNKAKYDNYKKEYTKYDHNIFVIGYTPTLNNHIITTEENFSPVTLGKTVIL